MASLLRFDEFGMGLGLVFAILIIGTATSVVLNDIRSGEGVCTQCMEDYDVLTFTDNVYTGDKNINIFSFDSNYIDTNTITANWLLVDDDGNIADNKYIAITHDGTDGYLYNGFGNLRVAPNNYFYVESGTHKIIFHPQQTASGEVPTGVFYGSYSNDDMTLTAASSSGLAGKKVVMAYYTSGGWRSMIEYANTASDFGELYLARSGGEVGINRYADNLAPLHVGNRNQENSVDSQILISRNIDESIAGNGHAFSDSSELDRNGNISYNSYDARINIVGSYDYGHYAAFQAAPTFNFTGTMADYYSVASVPNLTNSSDVTEIHSFYSKPVMSGTSTSDIRYGVDIYDVTLSDSADLNEQVGLYIDDLNNANYNYSMIIEGLTYNISSESIDDDGNIALSASVAGMLDVWVSGEYAQAYIDTDGSVTLINNSTNVANTDADGNLCIIDNGSNAIIKNRLGDTKTLRYEFKYS